MLTTDFPVQKVIGCRFESTEGHSVLRGVIEDAVHMERSLHFIMRNIEKEQPQGSGQWFRSDEPIAFSLKDVESWRTDDDGSVHVSVPYIGSFVIFIP